MGYWYIRLNICALKVSNVAFVVHFTEHYSLFIEYLKIQRVSCNIKLGIILPLKFTC